MKWLIVYYLCGCNLIDSWELRDERWQVIKIAILSKHMWERWERWKSSNRWWITFLLMWKVTGDISVKAIAAVPPHPPPCHRGCGSESNGGGAGLQSYFLCKKWWGGRTGEIGMGWNCAVLCRVGMRCIIFLRIPFLHRISTRAPGGIFFVKPTVVVRAWMVGRWGKT
jgi:hypothetical protein